MLTGARAVLYFGAQADAGLAHVALVLASELLVAVVAGLAITSWYDHKGLYRLSPDLITFVSRVADERAALVAARAGRRADRLMMLSCGS